MVIRLRLVILGSICDSLNFTLKKYKTINTILVPSIGRNFRNNPLPPIKFYFILNMGKFLYTDLKTLRMRRGWVGSKVLCGGVPPIYCSLWGKPPFSL